MKCPKCGSKTVLVQVMEKKSKTKKKGIGLGGHVNNTARALTAVSTLGLSNIVWKKSKGMDYTKNKNAAVAVCQDCGHMWEP